MLKNPVLALVMLGLLSGCWNGGNTSVVLGDVSLGEQLIDLKAALDAGAINRAEYDAGKAGLLALGRACQADADDEEDTAWF